MKKLPNISLQNTDSGGQIKNNDSPLDIETVDLSRIHYLSGPISVEDAEPGDILEVEILDVQPLSGENWGFTGIFDVNNGGGFLSDTYKKASKAIWDFEGIYASSRHVPGVKFVGESLVNYFTRGTCLTC